MPGCVLGIQAGVPGQEMSQAQTPGVALKRAAKIGTGDQFVTIDVGAIMANAGQQQPALTQLPGIFGIEAMQRRRGVELGQGRIRAEPLAMGRMLNAEC